MLSCRVLHGALLVHSYGRLKTGLEAFLPSSHPAKPLLRACDDFASLRAPLAGQVTKLIAKGARVTASLLFNLAGKKGVGHAAQPVVSDNVASGIDAERPRHGRPRIMDRGVGRFIRVVVIAVFGS